MTTGRINQVTILKSGCLPPGEGLESIHFCTIGSRMGWRLVLVRRLSRCCSVQTDTIHPQTLSSERFACRCNSNLLFDNFLSNVVQNCHLKWCRAHKCVPALSKGAPSVWVCAGEPNLYNQRFSLRHAPHKSVTLLNRCASRINASSLIMPKLCNELLRVAFGTENVFV